MVERLGSVVDSAGILVNEKWISIAPFDDHRSVAVSAHEQGGACSERRHQLFSNDIFIARVLTAPYLY